jgi:serine/threonine protein kinase
MEAQLNHHPAPEVLRAMVAGQLDSAAADSAFAHLETCPVCRETAAALSGDSFLRRLRAARPSGSATPETRAAGDTQGSKPGVPTETYVPPDILLELRDHPQYEVVRELGRGGMGVVYLARNKLMDRPEVLKVVGKHLLDHPGAAERFQREIRSAAKLSHPHIVTAHAAFQAGDLLVFAMEFVEGETLAEVVKARGRLPVVNACYYAQQVAQGLQHACDRGMVHRDVKPQNLILARQGKKHTVKILDFGLAKATRERGLDDGGLTGAGAMLGTPDYIAPEQTLDAAGADIRADIYSLGCTLYFLLIGAAPFQGKSTFEVLQAQQSKEAIPLDQVRVDVPAPLAAVVAKMMAKDPARRYQKPAEVVQALAPFVQGGAKPPTAPPAPPTSPPTPPPGGVIAAPLPITIVAPGNTAAEPGRSSRGLPLFLGLAAAGLLGIAALGAGAVYLFNHGTKAESAGGAGQDVNQEDASQKNVAAGQGSDNGGGSWAPGKAPANLRTTVEFVDYEVASSRMNGRVWESTLRAKSRKGDHSIRFVTLTVTTDEGKQFQVRRGWVMAPGDVANVTESKTTEIKMNMGNLPPGVKKLARVELGGELASIAPGPRQPVIFLDVPIEPDHGDAGQRVPANLRTTVEYVDYEVASSRMNGRVWEFSVAAKARKGDHSIRFVTLTVTTDEGKEFQLPRYHVMAPGEVAAVSEGKTREIKMSMSNLPPGVKKLARVELNGEPGSMAPGPREPVIFLDVPIDPDPAAAGSPPGGK